MALRTRYHKARDSVPPNASFDPPGLAMEHKDRRTSVFVSCLSPALAQYHSTPFALRAASRQTEGNLRPLQ